MMIKSRYTLLCAAAAVLGIAACDIDPEQAPPTSIDGSGTVTGQVYFDANGNGTFDPLGGDTALTSATVDLSARGDSAHVLKSTTTNTSGNFTFVGVPLGTHEVRARVAGNQIVTCVPVPVTVQVSAQAFASTPLRVSCRIDIVEAENRTSGSVVTVGGIVTAAPGVYRNNNGYIQDATGGIQIFAGAISTSSGIQEGDSIEATGVLAPFQNEMELSPTNTFRIVTRGRPVEARLYTIRQIRDAFAVSGQRAKPVGELVLLKATRFIGFATPTASGTDGRLVQGSDTLAIRLDQAQNTADFRAYFATDKCYDVTGTLGQFGSTLQLKPRRVSDAPEVTCPAN